MFDKILQVNLLYDFYGQLLTEKQQSVLELYYGDDLSLGEISEELNVSRQAIYDTIKRTEKLLFGYEEKLGLVHKFVITQNQVQKIIDIVEEIETKEPIENSFTLENMKKIKAISYDILEK